MNGNWKNLDLILSWIVFELEEKEIAIRILQGRPPDEEARGEIRQFYQDKLAKLMEAE